MKRWIIACTLLIHTHQLIEAQQDLQLPGLVVEQNSQFNTGRLRYLPDVEVRAEGNSTASDTEGRFTLVFADRPPGNVASVHAAKHGYVLVNPTELQQAAVIGRSSPLKVVMCDQDQLYENQMAYFRIARDAKVEACRRQIALLERDGEEQTAMIANLEADYRVRLDDAAAARALLEEQYHRVQQQAEELAAQFVTMNLDDQSPTYQRAFRAFLDRDVERAIRIMDSVDLRGRLQDNQALLRQIEAVIAEKRTARGAAVKQMEQDIAQAALSARMHKLQYHFREADSLYALALAFTTDTSHLDLEIEYGEFLIDIMQPTRAHWMFADLLPIYRYLAQVDPARHLPSMARVLRNLGRIEAVQKSKGLARRHLEEAAGIWQALARRDPSYLRALVHSWLDLAWLLSSNDPNSARDYFEKAIAVMRRWERKHPDFYSKDVAAVLVSFAGYLENSEEKDLKFQCYSEALKIYRGLAAQYPDSFSCRLALTLSDMGLAYFLSLRHSDARACLEEAVGIWERLVLVEGRGHLKDLAVTHGFLGEVYVHLNDYVNGVAHLKRAVEVHEEYLKAHQPIQTHIEVEILLTLVRLHQQLLFTTEDTEHCDRGAFLLERVSDLLEGGSEGHYTPFYVSSLDDWRKPLQMFGAVLNSEEGMVPILKSCTNNSTRITESISQQKALVQVLDSLNDFYADSMALKTQLVDARCQLAWYQVLSQDFAAAEATARRGIGKLPDELALYNPLLLALLYQARWKEATKLHDFIRNHWRRPQEVIVILTDEIYNLDPSLIRLDSIRGIKLLRKSEAWHPSVLR